MGMSHWVDVGPVPTPEQNLREKVSWLVDLVPEVGSAPLNVGTEKGR